MGIKNTLRIIVPYSVFIIVYLLLIKAFFCISNVVSIKYLLVQCFVILLPGLVCVKYLLIKRDNSIVHWISLGYAFGYSISIIEYLIVWGLHLQQFASLIVIFISCIAGFLWFYKPIDIELKIEKQDDCIFIVFFAIYLLINIITYSGTNISPFIGAGGSNIARDSQFWCSNAVALKNSFPPSSTYFVGATLYYHYFSSMQIAFMSQITGIPVFDVAFTLFSFGKCVLLIGSLNYLVDRYRIGIIKVFFFLLILFMTGWETSSLVTYGCHLNYLPFGFDIGFAYGLLFVALILDLFDNPQLDLRQFLSIMIIWGTLSGVKGPIAVLLLAIPALLFSTWLLNGKIKLSVIYSVGVIVIFLAVNIYCVGIFRILNHTAEGRAGVVRGFRTILEVIAEGPFEPSYIYILPTLIWRALVTHPVLCILTVIDTAFLIWLLMKKENQNNTTKELIFLCISIIGFLMGVFYSAGGRSEMYFSMATYITGVVYNMEIIKTIIEKRVFCISIIKALYATVMSVLSIVGVYCWMFEDYFGGIVYSLNEGCSRISNNWEIPDNESGFLQREANACAWIRDNTPQDSIVQSNRYICYPTGSFYVGMFSERSQYLEESSLIYYCDLHIDEPHIESREVLRRGKVITNAFMGDVSSLDQLREEGVDYLIQDNMLYDNALRDSGLDAVYEQDGIIVYSVND